MEEREKRKDVRWMSEERGYRGRSFVVMEGRREKVGEGGFCFTMG